MPFMIAIFADHLRVVKRVQCHQARFAQTAVKSFGRSFGQSFATLASFLGHVFWRRNAL
jgi:hypothetical protein